MRTTIPKLRRIIRKTLTESMDARGLNQKHLDDLADWITQASEDGMEEDYETTIYSYIEACADSSPPEIVDYDFVSMHLDDILERHDSIDDVGGLICDPDVMDEP